MADRSDIATVIKSALAEVGVAGKLNVEMDGKAVTTTVGAPTGDDVDVTVVVTPRAD
jgi:hypothetical protein